MPACRSDGIALLAGSPVFATSWIGLVSCLSRFQVAEWRSVRFNTAEANAFSSFIGVRINETVQATAGCSCCPGTAGSCGCSLLWRPAPLKSVLPVSPTMRLCLKARCLSSRSPASPSSRMFIRPTGPTKRSANDCSCNASFLNGEAFLLLGRNVLDLFRARDECSQHVINPT